MHGTVPRPLIDMTDEQALYIASAHNRGFKDKILAAFDRADKLRIAFVGETIIDEYRYVQALGKSSKEITLAVLETGVETFSGGVLAASRHAEWPKRVILSDEPITKTRFVDRDFNRKLFEVYDAQVIRLSPPARAKFQTDMIRAVRDCDVVVLLDFGHGLMDKPERHIASTARFLALNAQTNAGNHGFNPVTKYQRADFVCIDEPEARLATHEQDEDISLVAMHLAGRTEYRNLVITRGRYGCLCRELDGGPITIPPFAINGIDTMGAGDAFLAVTAPLIAAGLELEPAAFVGNVAGAIKCGIVGHRRHVGRGELVQTIEELLV